MRLRAHTTPSSGLELTLVRVNAIHSLGCLLGKALATLSFRADKVHSVTGQAPLQGPGIATKMLVSTRVLSTHGLSIARTPQ